MICSSLFFLKKKVTKKFKDNPIAPRVCPARATSAGVFMTFKIFDEGLFLNCNYLTITFLLINFFLKKKPTGR